MSLQQKASNEITSMSAAGMAREIRAGRLSSREAVEAHIARIEEVNPALNAVVVPLYEEARREAEERDAERARGAELGELHGVPFTVKESFDVAGTPTTMGLSKLVSHRAAEDAPLVARLRRAGAVLLGKTNVPQLLMLNETDNPAYGRTNNPWNKERTPGGSSGGCAAIVAAGGSPLSMGSDIGGSVRFPAHCCGIHSLKPTSGRLTMLGHAEIFPGQEAVIAQPGPLARSAADLGLAMRVLAAPGQESFDISVAPVAWREPSDVQVEGLRVAFFDDNKILRPSPAVRRAVGEAAEALAARGVEVEEWTPPDVAHAWDIYQGLLFADGMVSSRRLLRGSAPDWRIRRILLSLLTPRSMFRLAAWEFSLLGQTRMSNTFRRLGRRTVDAYWQLAAERARYRARFTRALDEGRFDAVLCPPQALPAVTHGDSFYTTDSLSYSALFNLTGMPAGVVSTTRVRAGEESDRAAGNDFVERIALKVERGSAGLPVGVQVVARHWREDIVLALMSALEEHFKARPDYPQKELVH